jgi:hypothetical protein
MEIEIMEATILRIKKVTVTAITATGNTQNSVYHNTSILSRLRGIFNENRQNPEL